MDSKFWLRLQLLVVMVWPPSNNKLDLLTPLDFQTTNIVLPVSATFCYIQERFDLVNLTWMTSWKNSQPKEN